MTMTIHPSAVSGSLSAAASKSWVQRLVALACLAEGTTLIRNVSYCDDIEAALRIAAGLGALVERQDSTLSIRGLALGSDRRQPDAADRQLACGESGLAIRMFSPIAALFAGTTSLQATGSLRRRPSRLIVEALSAVGVAVQDVSGYPPVTLSGPLRGGPAVIDGSASSQLLTGLLLALPLAAADSRLSVQHLKSRPYIDLTLELSEMFGAGLVNRNYQHFEIPGRQHYVSPGAVDAEGDWSGAAIFLVAAALAGRIELTNLQLSSSQADKAILDVLRLAGVPVVRSADGLVAERPARLLPFDFDAGDCPDLFPPLVALASACDGRSSIGGVGRLRHKESDRAASLQAEFGKLGIRVELAGDRMYVSGGQPRNCRVDSHEDHRIAMALAVAALRGRGSLHLDGAQAVNKSWPSFYDDLKALGVKIDE